MSHTPGDWVVERGENGVFYVSAADSTISIAKVLVDDDAELIALAPRLLASLKALVADIQEEMWSVSKCWCHQITASERPCDICDLAAAKALIAEIEGGA